MRVIGLDVHRTFAAVAVLDNTQLSHPGRVELTREAVLAFGRKLRPDDEVVIEATVNTAMIARLLHPFVGKVIIANPLQVRATAHAKIKTDKIDATVLAKLHASGFLPEVWMPDEATETLRRLVSQRTQVVQQMTRVKNRIHSILHANLIPLYRGRLFGLIKSDGSLLPFFERPVSAVLAAMTISALLWPAFIWSWRRFRPRQQEHAL